MYCHNLSWKCVLLFFKLMGANALLKTFEWVTISLLSVVDLTFKKLHRQVLCHDFDNMVCVFKLVKKIVLIKIILFASHR